jgi:hypothetical protein
MYPQIVLPRDLSKIKGLKDYPTMYITYGPLRRALAPYIHIPTLAVGVFEFPPGGHPTLCTPKCAVKPRAQHCWDVMLPHLQASHLGRDSTRRMGRRLSHQVLRYTRAHQALWYPGGETGGGVVFTMRNGSAAISFVVGTSGAGSENDKISRAVGEEIKADLAEALRSASSRQALVR